MTAVTSTQEGPDALERSEAIEMSRAKKTLAGVVSINITVMDFAYRYPEVKYLVLGYTVIAALLVAYDRPRLRLMLARSEDVAVAVAAVSRRSRY